MTRHEELLQSALSLIRLNGSTLLDNFLKKYPSILDEAGVNTKMYLFNEIIKKTNVNMVDVFLNNLPSQEAFELVNMEPDASFLMRALNKYFEVMNHNKKSVCAKEVFQLLCDKGARFSNHEEYKIKNYYSLAPKYPELKECLNYYEITQEKNKLENVITHVDLNPSLNTKNKL
jgi:uncharacterized protein Usg